MKRFAMAGILSALLTGCGNNQAPQVAPPPPNKPGVEVHAPGVDVKVGEGKVDVKAPGADVEVERK